MVGKENIAEYYFKDLHTTTKPVPHLTAFICEVLGRPPTKGDYVKIGRLIKMYGRDSVFFSVLDIYDIELTTDDYYPLLVHLAKRRLEVRNKQNSQPEMVNLSSEVRALEKQLKKIQRKT